MTEQQFCRSSGFLLERHSELWPSKCSTMLQAPKASVSVLCLICIATFPLKTSNDPRDECKAADGVKYKNILARYGIKSYSKFLSVSSNKAEPLFKSSC